MSGQPKALASLSAAARCAAAAVFGIPTKGNGRDQRNSDGSAATAGTTIKTAATANQALEVRIRIIFHPEVKTQLSGRVPKWMAYQCQSGDLPTEWQERSLAT